MDSLISFISSHIVADSAANLGFIITSPLSYFFSFFLGIGASLLFRLFARNQSESLGQLSTRWAVYAGVLILAVAFTGNSPRNMTYDEIIFVVGGLMVTDLLRLWRQQKSVSAV